MSVNPDTNTEEERETEATGAANFPTGGATELLAVRVSPALLSALKASAAAREKPFAELVRSLLVFHLLPSIIGATVDSMASGQGKPEHLERARLETGAARELLARERENIAAARVQLQQLEALNIATDKSLERAQEQAGAAWRDYIARLCERKPEPGDGTEAGRSGEVTA